VLLLEFVCKFRSAICCVRHYACRPRTRKVITVADNMNRQVVRLKLGELLIFCYMDRKQICGGTITKWHVCQFSGFRSVTAEETSVILERHAASLGKWFPTFRENILVSPSRVGMSKKIF
jgi:hypothetical protein